MIAFAYQVFFHEGHDLAVVGGHFPGMGDERHVGRDVVALIEGNEGFKKIAGAGTEFGHGDQVFGLQVQRHVGEDRKLFRHGFEADEGRPVAFGNMRNLRIENVKPLALAGQFAQGDRQHAGHHPGLVAEQGFGGTGRQVYIVADQRLVGVRDEVPQGFAGGQDQEPGIFHGGLQQLLLIAQFSQFERHDRGFVQCCCGFGRQAGDARISDMGGAQQEGWRHTVTLDLPEQGLAIGDGLGLGHDGGIGGGVRRLEFGHQIGALAQGRLGLSRSMCGEAGGEQGEQARDEAGHARGWALRYWARRWALFTSV